MRYRATIEIDHLAADADPVATRDALRSALTADLGRSRDHFSAVDVAVSDAYRRGMLTVSATLEGRGLTSPLGALTQLDSSLDRSLLATGLFEEFDVARKALRVAPLDRLFEP